jgi:hypothetical protein
MKKQITYSFEREDANPLRSEFADQIFNLVRGLATEEETSEARPHPGIKALRHMRGNSFTAEHVLEFRDYIVELCSRSLARIKELEAERDRLAKDDPHSRKAYDGLIDGINSSYNLALRDMDSFMQEFREVTMDDLPAATRSFG